MNQFPVPHSSSSQGNSGLTLRKLIRNKRTKTFLATDGTWTCEIQQALPISDPMADVAGMGLDGKELEVYYSFDDRQQTQWDFAVALKRRQT